MVLGIQAILDAHHDWVVFQVDITNIFNTISHKAIFQKFKQWGTYHHNFFPLFVFFMAFEFFCILVIIFL